MWSLLTEKKKKESIQISNHLLKHLCPTAWQNWSTAHNTSPYMLSPLVQAGSYDGLYSHPSLHIQPTKVSGVTWLVYRSLLHLQKKYCHVSTYWPYTAVRTDQQHLLLKPGCWLCCASLHPWYCRVFALEHGLVTAALLGSCSCSTSETLLIFKDPFDKLPMSFTCSATIL